MIRLSYLSNQSLSVRSQQDHFAMRIALRFRDPCYGAASACNPVATPARSWIVRVAEIKFTSAASVGTIIPFSGKGKENTETFDLQKTVEIALNLDEVHTRRWSQ